MHGDYRLDNCMLGDDGSIKAVLDWEICTLGDPLADVGLLLAYWSSADDDAASLLTSATTAPGFASRDDLLARYGAVTGRDLDQIEFYVSFAYWKLACILEGVYSRYLGGALGARDPAGPGAVRAPGRRRHRPPQEHLAGSGERSDGPRAETGGHGEWRDHGPRAAAARRNRCWS